MWILHADGVQMQQQMNITARCMHGYPITRVHENVNLNDDITMCSCQSYCTGFVHSRMQHQIQQGLIGEQLAELQLRQPNH